MRYMKTLLLLSLFLIVVLSTPSNIKKLLSSYPGKAPRSFDCAARLLGFEYAQKIQPWIGTDGKLRLVYDALELSTCGHSYDKLKPPVKKESPNLQKVNAPPPDATFYVSVKGSDLNAGTIDKPFLTIARALQVTRTITGAKGIILRQGTYYLTGTIKLTSADNNLTISNYQNEEVEISGGIPLNLTWKPFNVSNTPTTIIYDNFSNILRSGVAPHTNTSRIKYLGDFLTTQQCADACMKFNVGGQKCYSFTYFTPTIPTVWAKGCYGDVTQIWGPSVQNAVNSGKIVQMNVYVADLSSQNIEDIPGLQLAHGMGRCIRARYPDANPETSFFPEGWLPSPEKFLPPKSYPDANSIIVNSPARTDINMFQKYTVGVGGPCEIFSPQESYWCSKYCDGGGAFTFITPTGLVFSNSTFSGRKWKNPTAAVAHVWHQYHWALWMYNVNSYSAETNTIGWSEGGFQGARGGKVGSEWFIENVFEELDSPNEYFFDKATKKLYLFYNESSAINSEEFVATNLKTLIEINGTRMNPIVGITIKGIKFTGAAYTFMDPHGVPSGGDWAMQRTAAIILEATVGTTIDSCVFQRLDGNGLILSGYNRDAVIQKSEFAWIGDSPLVAWGYTQGIDGTDGNQPRFTKVLYNFFREFGIIEKQSSPWFQAKTSQTLLQGNIAFNGPRALINFNDGFGGGNEIKNNFLFNPNRETSDQGPFNSWDRQPFLTDVRDGTPSLTPAYNEIHDNFFFCNYGSNMCVDNDDGSSWYKIYKNFEVYGGHKSDFGGHNKFTYDSVLAYAQMYEDGLCGDFNSVVAGFVDGFFNNICIQNPKKPYITIDECDVKNLDAAKFPLMNDNRIFTVDGNTSILCGKTEVSSAHWQALGFDLGTTVAKIPTDEQIILWGREVLGMN